MATRYIAVAAPSTDTNNEWLLIDPRRSFLPPVHQDYALMKVLYPLRRTTKAAGIRVNSFKFDKQNLTPLNFQHLQDTDVIFIAGHGNPKGLYAMGPNGKRGVDRLVDILTGDGNLKKLRTGKEVIIALLSCRAGFGFHKGLARRLTVRLGIPVTVGGALGFTFGSPETTTTALNESLIRGIPWDMEYFLSIPRGEAEQLTSAREGKTLTVAGKQTEINQFKAKKTDLEKRLTKLVQQLRSTEINLALDEIEARWQSPWLQLVKAQFALYHNAKKTVANGGSNLEFDMWHDPVADGYVWTNGNNVTDKQADDLLEGDQVPVGDGYTSTR